MLLYELIDVKKYYNLGKSNECRALNNISLTITQGEMLCIVGESGSGKSTLLNLLAGIDRATEGTVVFKGQNLGQMSYNQSAAYRNGQVGFVMQEFLLINNISSLENVMLPLQFSRSPNRSEDKTTAIKLLKGVGLSAKINEKVGNLSGGEKQRVAVARALACDPDVILADEPTGSLDKKNKNEIFAMLQRINRRGKTVIIVTHEESLASQCDRIITLSDGAVISDISNNQQPE